MNNKMTSKRFNEHMSYDWLKYVCIILAVILFWVLLFSIGSAKLKTSEIFEICIASRYQYVKEFDKLNDEILSETSFIQDSSIAHYIHKEKNFYDLIYGKITTKQGDLFIFDDTKTEYAEDGSLKKDEYGNIISQKNLFLEYIDNGLFQPLDELIEKGINLEYADVEEDVLKYLKKHNSYKSEAKKQEFIADYKARIPAIREASLYLQNFLTQHEELAVKYKQGEQYKRFNPHKDLAVAEVEHIWGIRLNDTYSDKINDFLGNGVDNDNNKRPINYAMGVTAYDGENKPFEFESLIVIKMLLEKYY